jgi:hypothetical protein
LSFIAIYRWRVEPEHEAAFRSAWKSATEALRSAGGLGSCLGRGADGTLVAVAPWHSRQSREDAFARVGDGLQWPPCERLEAIEIDVIDDLWLTSPFAPGR